MTPQEHKWVETNNSLCAVLRQVHDVLALSSLPPKRPWAGLTKKDFSAIDQSCLTKLQAVISAESVLKERNT